MFISKMKAGLWAAATLSAGLTLVGPANAKPAVPSKDAELPFAFRAGKQFMPPGKYRLERRSPGGSSFYLRNVETGRALILLSTNRNDQQPIQLTFGKDQAGYVLRKVR